MDGIRTRKRLNILLHNPYKKIKITIYFQITNYIFRSLLDTILNYREVKNLRKYKCRVCNYIYDPERGEPRTNTPPGTSFEDLPETWRCPKCGVPKFKFSPI